MLDTAILVISLLSINITPISNQYNTQLTRSTYSSSTFYQIGSSEKVKAIDFKDGYVYYQIGIYKSEYTEKSNLYLFNVNMEFVPGHVANLNGDKSYDKGRYLSKGNLRFYVERYINSENEKQGPSFVFKESWPTSSTFTSTFSSSYGFNLSLSDLFTTGIEIGNGASLKVENQIGTTLGFSFDKTHSTVVESPILSTQTSPNNPNEQQWSFSVPGSDHKYSGAVTYHLDTYYLFEMDNYSYIGDNENAFIAHVDISCKMQYSIIGNWTAEGDTKTHGLQWNCFMN